MLTLPSSYSLMLYLLFSHTLHLEKGGKAKQVSIFLERGRFQNHFSWQSAIVAHEKEKQDILNFILYHPAVVRNVNIFISKILAEDVILHHLYMFCKNELNEQILNLPQWKMKSVLYPHNKSNHSKIRVDKPLLKHSSMLFTSFCCTHHCCLNHIFPVLLPYFYPGRNTMCLIFKYAFPLSR